MSLVITIGVVVLRGLSWFLNENGCCIYTQQCLCYWKYWKWYDTCLLCCLMNYHAFSSRVLSAVPFFRSFRQTSHHEAKMPEIAAHKKQRQITYDTLYVGPKTVLYIWGPAIPLNCAMAFVSPMPIPTATVPSRTRIRSGQMTGYAEPAQAVATIKARYLTVELWTVIKMI